MRLDGEKREHGLNIAVPDPCRVLVLWGGLEREAKERRVVFGLIAALGREQRAGRPGATGGSQFPER
ncbi:MAG: hypothetical protein EpisKO_25040 [Epibacterium sp.]